MVLWPICLTHVMFFRPKRSIATTPTIDAAKVDGEETVAIDSGTKQANSKTADVENAV